MDWGIYYVLTHPRCPGGTTLREVEEFWSVDDLDRMRYVLNALDAVEASRGPA